MERTFTDGIVRKTVHFVLLEEDNTISGELNEWPGGSKQIYRESGRPLTELLLREVRAYSKGNEASPSRTPPEVTAEDIRDFDGTAVIST